MVPPLPFIMISIWVVILHDGLTDIYEVGFVRKPNRARSVAWSGPPLTILPSFLLSLEHTSEVSVRGLSLRVH